MKSEIPSYFTVCKAAGCLASLLLSNSVCAIGTGVFINEIHYDNTGADTGESIEIAGPIGTDLNGWSLVPYNGSGGLSYSTTPLSGAIPPPGTLVFPIAGLQNGAPDGVALVDDASAVVQFLSYEGTFTAADGPANGMLSVDIGVAESGSDPVGYSLQLTGTGQVYEDFTWAAAQPNTMGAVNTGQVFDAGGVPALVINEIDYDQPGTDAAEFVEIRNNSGATVGLAGWSLELVNGSGPAVYQTIDLAGFSIPPADYFVVCANSATVPNCDLDVTPDTGLVQNGAPDAVALRVGGVLVDTVSYEGDTGAPYTEGSGIGLEDLAVEKLGISRYPDGVDTDQNNVDFSQRCISPGEANLAANSGCVRLVINEIDYDQPGADLAEFIEIMNAGSAEADLTGFQVAQINGGNGAVTTIATLPSVSLAPNDYYVICGNAGLVSNCDLVLGQASDLVQNGAPDAVALLDNLDVVIDTVSYEGDVPGYTEGSGAGLEDAFADGSISRCPDGTDTDQNNVDFIFTETISPGAQNECGAVVEACGDPATPIHDIQGSGLASSIVGSAVSIEGVVVGDFQDGASGTHGDLDGFFVQEEDDEADVDDGTSEGIFVYDGSLPAVDVQAGDRVRVSGTVNEFSGLTEISALTLVAVCAQGVGLPGATEVPLPVTAITDFEKYEGMRVTVPAAVISEYSDFDRYGEIRVSPERLYQPTAVFDPGSPEAADLAILNAMSQVTLDDGRTVQNPDPAIHPNGAEFDLDNRFRGGDMLENVTGVMDDRFDKYRIQPTQGALHTGANPRTAQPAETGGGIRVATFNLLNYFNGDGLGGGFPTSRGADTLAEFNRQRDKILAALLAMDADVVGVVEIENDGYDATSAIQDLVNGLNDATAPGNYAFVDPGVAVIGTDEIAVGLLYKPSTVGLTGDTAILDSSVDPDFLDTKNRPALAQSFVEVSSSEVFTVVVNHLKSKGSSCDDVGDPDTGDGSGNCNLTRTKAAQALVTWLAGDPTTSGDTDFLVIGDLNAYDKEDPIDTFVANGYSDLLASHEGEFAYSYLFDAQLGYLDYALTSSTLTGQVTGATAWHINADEPDLIDYDTSFKLPAQQAIYAPDAYRSSDHDAVVVGLDLGPRPDLVFRNGFESE